jgi:hypothetical protein
MKFRAEKAQIDLNWSRDRTIGTNRGAYVASQTCSFMRHLVGRDKYIRIREKSLDAGKTREHRGRRQEGLGGIEAKSNTLKQVQPRLRVGEASSMLGLQPAGMTRISRTVVIVRESERARRCATLNTTIKFALLRRSYLSSI